MTTADKPFDRAKGPLALFFLGEEWAKNKKVFNFCIQELEGNYYFKKVCRDDTDMLVIKSMAHFEEMTTGESLPGDKHCIVAVVITSEDLARMVACAMAKITKNVFAVRISSGEPITDNGSYRMINLEPTSLNMPIRGLFTALLALEPAFP